MKKVDVDFEKQKRGVLELDVLNTYLYFSFPNANQEINLKMENEKVKISLAQLKERLREANGDLIMISEEIYNQEKYVEETDELSKIHGLFQKISEIEKVVVLPKAGLIRGEIVYCIEVPKSENIEDCRFFEFIFDGASFNESSII